MRQYELMIILDPEIEERTVAPSLDKYLTVISTDGASHLSKQVVGNVTEVTQLLKDSTGIDLASLLNGFVGGRSSAAAASTDASAPATADAPAPVAAAPVAAAAE